MTTHVNDTRPDGEERDVVLLLLRGQRARERVQARLVHAVHAPGLVSCSAGAGRDEHDAARLALRSRFAQVRHRRLDQVERREEVDLDRRHERVERHVGELACGLACISFTS